jgi:hypothetical protein
MFWVKVTITIISGIFTYAFILKIKQGYEEISAEELRKRQEFNDKLEEDKNKLLELLTNEDNP